MQHYIDSIRYKLFKRNRKIHELNKLTAMAEVNFKNNQDKMVLNDTHIYIVTRCANKEY